jgi:single-strand selective monofunctional uracil DNA glycosylase
MNPSQITDALVDDLKDLRFGTPVTYVYNPLVYARKPYDLYFAQYGLAPKEFVFVGMNPGPWGMAQTGVPFGEVAEVRDWLGIEAPVGKPVREHPKRPVLGFCCHRSEVSGRRVWGWARSRFRTPERFFSRAFIANYCPLLFLEESGRNRTPDKLPATERTRLFEACDRALRRMVQHFEPDVVIGIGRFAEERSRSALNGSAVTIARVTHPSPANPAANRGWERLVEQELKAIGVDL